MICKKCASVFSPKIVIGGKEHILSSRRYCLSCSPFKRHNTKRLHLVTAYEESTCKRCQKRYKYKRGEGNTLTYCAGCSSTTRKRRLKERAVEYLGKSCARCGYSRCLNALEFHHRDAKTKTFSIACNFNRSWKTIQAELDKCTLLCANCHREVEADNFCPGGAAVAQFAYTEKVAGSIPAPGTTL